MAEKTLEQQIKLARRTGTPFVAIATPDAAQTMPVVRDAIAKDVPRIAWDCAAGIQPLNDAARDMLGALTEKWNEGLNQESDRDPVVFLTRCAEFKAGTAVIASGLSSWVTISDAATALTVEQAMWNLRDPYKKTKRTLIMLDPAPTFGPLVARDVFMLNDPLPSKDALGTLVGEVAKSYNITVEPDNAAHAVKAVLGLPKFLSEQALYMATEPNGINLDDLWEHKRSMIDKTPGLSVWRGGETFADVRGLGNLREFLSDLIRVGGFDGVVWIDEIEKLVPQAAMAGDNTGSTQAIQMAFLTYMENNSVDGITLVGPPGGGKSLIAKAIGGEARCPTIQFDLSELRNSLLGSTEARTRQAFTTIDAITNRKPLFVATSNGIEGLSPEFRQRFTLGEWFVDLLAEEERVACFELYEEKFGVTPDRSISHEGWSGRNIRNCVRLASRLQISEAKAAGYVVPVSRSSGEQIRRLRQQAHGRYLNASAPGTYDLEQNNVVTVDTSVLRQVDRD